MTNELSRLQQGNVLICNLDFNGVRKQQENIIQEKTKCTSQHEK